MIHFISDTHFGHENILRYDNRPFASIEEHDEALLNNINSVLEPGDTLYHLGDVAWNQKAYEWFFENLKGEINVQLIRGNHDNRGSLPWFVPKDVVYRNDMRKGAPPFFLSHYPHLSWPNRFHGSIHLFGHVHGNLKGVGRSMDVSANMINYTPISIVDVIDKLSLVEAGE
jgi:calcineurin-like phosphoesterase family protein